MGFIVLFVLALVSGIQAGTVLEDIEAVPDYSKFLGWLDDATKTTLNATDVLSTIFIPKNDAVQKWLDMHPDMVDKTAMLNALAKYSMVVGNFTLDELKKAGKLMKDGLTLWVDSMESTVYINNAKVTKSMMSTVNGMIHEIDAVIYPKGSDKNLKQVIDDTAVYSGLKSLVGIATDVGSVLENATLMLTVFSPNAEAVTAGMKQMNATQLLPVIQGHVIGDHVTFSTMLMGSSPIQSLKPGGMIYVKTMDNMVFVGSAGYWSMVESGDLSTSNGVIHLINGVIGVTPGVNLYQALGLFDSSKFGTTLTKISASAELKKALMNTTAMYTVFSPQNTAWDAVKDSEIKDVGKALKRHVLMGKMTAAELMKKTEVTTLSGEKLMVKTDGAKVYLEFNNTKAMVTSTDNMASNGIIHSIDKVLRNSACVTSVSLAAAVISLAFTLLCY